ncbi:ROK family protein [Eubacteriales bacterium mix99]
MHYMGFDIGGTSIKYGVLTGTGEIVLRDSFPTPENEEQILHQMEQAFFLCRKQVSDIAGIGISSPGQMAEDGTLIVAGAIHSLYGVNLKKGLEKKAAIPVVIENDANCAAIAEQWIGNARDCKNYICVVLGTGVGGGVVLNNHLYKGSHGLSGEFGFSIIDGVPETGNIEDATLNYKDAVVLGLYNQYNLTRKALGLPMDETIDARQIIALNNADDPVAKKVLHKYYVDLSTLFINIISFFDPDKIIVGGGISSNFQFIKELNETFEEMFARHESLANIGRDKMAKIVPAKLSNDAGLTGAAFLIHQKLQNK